MNYTVDEKRLAKARADFVALQKAEADAKAAVETARQAVKKAEDDSIAAAHAGKPDSVLEGLERVCEDADRSASVSRKKLVAATARREAGEEKLAEEVRQAHAKAIAEAVQSQLAALAEAHRLKRQIDAVDARFQAARSALHVLFQQGAGMQVPRAVSNVHALFGAMTPDKLIPENEYIAHLVGDRWDVEAGKFSWME